MGEPARQLYDDDYSPEAVTRPDLHALEGGGQSSTPKRGHLHSVGEDGGNGSLSPENLNEAEQSAPSPQTSVPESNEQSSVAEPSLFTDDSSPKGGMIARLSRRKRGIAIGTVVSIVGGGTAFFSIASGPWQVIQYAQTFMPSFSNHEKAGSSRMSGLYRWARTSEVGETRVSFVGSKIVARMRANLANDGITISSTGYSGQMKSLIIETKKNSLYSSVDDAAKNREAIARDNGVALEKVRQINGLNGGKFHIDLSSASITEKRAILRAHIENQNYGKIISAAKFRTLTKFYDAPSWLHPIKRLSTTIDGKIDGRIANSEFFKARQAERAAKISARTSEANARAEVIKGKLKTTAGVAGALLLGSAALCVAKDVASQIPDINRDNIIVPSMKSAVDIISLGSQTMLGKDIDMNQLGEVVKNFTDSDGKTVWESKALQSEMGETGGTDIDPNIKQAFSPNNTAANFEKELDQYGANSACSGIGQAIQTVGGAALLILGPGGWAAKGVQTVASAAAIAAITEFVPKLLADEPLTGTPHQGPKGGNVDAYGAREVANTAYRATGGAELSSTDSAILKKDRQAEDKLDFQSRSFARRVFDVYDRRSVIAKFIDKQSSSPTQNFANFARGLLSGPAHISSLFSALSAPAMAAADVPYEYGFPEYGFSKEDLGKTILEDPYANADEAVKILTGSDGQKYKDRAKTCFGVDIAKKEGIGWDATHVGDINPSSAKYSEEKCVDSDNPDWLRIRMFIFDTRTMVSYACYEGDDASCSDTGFSGSPSSTTTPVPATQTTGTTNGDSIYILGDSLSIGMKSQGDLEAKLKSTGWVNTTVQAYCGRHLKGTGDRCGSENPAPFDGLGQVDQPDDKALIGAASSIVISLGTNDYASTTFKTDATALIDKIRGLNKTATLYWINLYAADSVRAPKLPAMNAALQELVLSKNIIVIDWAAVASPSYADSGDGIHPTDHYDDMADVVTDTIGGP